MTATSRTEIRLSDLPEARSLALHRETHDPLVVAHFTIDGEPESKLRARWDPRRGGRPTTPKRTKEAERTIAWLFRQAAGPFRLDKTSRFGVFAVFVCHPSRPRDGDNMLKLVLDALTGLCWVDDTQVDEQSTKTVYAHSGLRTELVVYRTPDLAVAS